MRERRGRRRSGTGVRRRLRGIRDILTDDTRSNDPGRNDETTRGTSEGTTGGMTDATTAGTTAGMTMDGGTTRGIADDPGSRCCMRMKDPLPPNERTGSFVETNMSASKQASKRVRASTSGVVADRPAVGQGVPGDPEGAAALRARATFVRPLLLRAVC